MTAYSTVFSGSVKATLEIDQYDSMTPVFSTPKNIPGTQREVNVCEVELTIKVTKDAAIKARATAARRAYDPNETSQSYAMSSMLAVSKLGFPAGISNAENIVPTISDSDAEMLEEKLNSLPISTEAVITTRLGVGTRYYVYLVPDARNIFITIAPEGAEVQPTEQAAAAVGYIVITDKEYDDVEYTSEIPKDVAYASISDGRVVVEPIEMEVGYVDKSIAIVGMALKQRGTEFLYMYQDYLKRMFWVSGKFSDMGRYNNLLTYTYGIDASGRGIVVVDNRTASIERLRGGATIVTGRPTVYAIYGDVNFPLRANFVTGPKIFDIVSNSEVLTKYGPLTTAYLGAGADEPPFKYITSWDTRRSPTLVEVDGNNVTL